MDALLKSPQAYLPDRNINQEDLEVLLAISDTIIPSIQPTKPRAADSDTILLCDTEYQKKFLSILDKADPEVRPALIHKYLHEKPSDLPEFISATKKTLAALDPQARSCLAWFLRVLRSPLGSVAFTGSSTPFHLRDVATREKIVVSWSRSYITTLRLICRALTVLCRRIWVASSPTLYPLIGALQVPDIARAAQKSPFQFLQFNNQEDPHILSAEIVIIGSGCGAGVAAKNLAEAGYDVIVVEKSYHYTEESFQMNENEGLERLYEAKGLLTNDDGSVALLAGSTWGGGGTVNFSGSLQTPRMALERVCQRMKVTEKRLNHNFPNRTLLEGSKKLGFNVRNIPQNIGGLDHNCKSCIFGCSSGTKQGPMKTFLPDAAQSGARFIEGFKADRILFSSEGNQRVVQGVEGFWTNRESFLNGKMPEAQATSQKVVINAERVIICGGSLQSPLLLRRSGLKNPNVGGNLYLHPSCPVMAIFNENSNPWEGPIITALMDDLHNLDGYGHGVRIEACAGTPALLIPLFPWPGSQNSKDLAAKFRHAVVFVPLVRDRDPGKVYENDGYIKVEYAPSIFDRHSLKEGIIAAAEIAYANGAKEIYAATSDITPFFRGGETTDSAFREWVSEIRDCVSLELHSSVFASAHQMGTCRMSATPNDGAVNENGEVWGTSGLFVSDASVFPNATGVNPMVTIMAISDYISRRIIINNYPQMTPENVLALIPDVKAMEDTADIETAPKADSAEKNRLQLRSEEMHIVVDEDDNEIGKATELTCHLMSNIRKGLMHRGFSFLLFDSQNRLLIQQRASKKPNWSDYWSNSCCSHPLAIPEESGTSFSSAIMGVKRSVQRNRKHKLGIKPQQVPLDKLRFLTRFRYQARSDCRWAENEIIYIFIMKADVDLVINPNEIRDYRYVTVEELEDMLQDPYVKFTPWFPLLYRKMLVKWWKAIENESLRLYEDDSRIYSFLKGTQDYVSPR